MADQLSGAEIMLRNFVASNGGSWSFMPEEFAGVVAEIDRLRAGVARLEAALAEKEFQARRVRALLDATQHVGDMLAKATRNLDFPTKAAYRQASDALMAWDYVRGQETT